MCRRSGYGRPESAHRRLTTGRADRRRSAAQTGDGTRHGYLTRRTYVVRGLNIAIYTLAVRGQRKLKQAGFGLIYHRNARQTPHDLKLTSIYYKLPADVRETWRHEGELICELKARGTHKRGYCVDAAVVIDGQSYGVEALSRHYKAQRLFKKSVKPF